MRAVAPLVSYALVRAVAPLVSPSTKNLKRSHPSTRSSRGPTSPRTQDAHQYVISFHLVRPLAELSCWDSISSFDLLSPMPCAMLDGGRASSL